MINQTSEHFIIKTPSLLLYYFVYILLKFTPDLDKMSTYRPKLKFITISNLSVIDTLNMPTESGGVGASGRLASAQCDQEGGQTPTETGHIDFDSPVADASQSHAEIAGGSDGQNDFEDIHSNFNMQDFIFVVNK